MALSDECVSRLENWKFAQARNRLGDTEPDGQERAVVCALADEFGDVGWFDGSAAERVRAELEPLIGDAAHTGSRFRDGLRESVRAAFGADDGDGPGRPAREIDTGAPDTLASGVAFARADIGAVAPGDRLLIRHQLNGHVTVDFIDRATGNLTFPDPAFMSLGNGLVDASFNGGYADLMVQVYG